MVGQGKVGKGRAGWTRWITVGIGEIHFCCQEADSVVMNAR